jgi:hypothetical protein
VQQHWQPSAPLFPPLPLDSNLDNFHIQQQGPRALRGEWQAAERLWVAAAAADGEVAQADRHGQNKRGPVKRARLAWAKAERAFTTAAQCERAWQRAAAALELFRPDGRLNDRAWAAAEITAAVAALPGERWAKACRLLQDRRALTFLDRLAQELAAAEPRPEVRQAVVRWWRLPPQCGVARPQGPAAVLAGVLQAHRCRQLAADWQASAARVAGVLQRCGPAAWSNA